MTRQKQTDAAGLRPISGGAALRRVRKDVLGMTQAQLAREAHVSAKSIQRAEGGHPTARETLRLIFQALAQQGIDSEQLRSLVDALNPIQSLPPAIDDMARLEVREGLRRHLLNCPNPAFIMDEYWFMRAVNVLVLALHRIEPRALALPEAWHSIAVKFHPALKTQELRGPRWADYYSVVVRKFHNDMQSLVGTPRHDRLISWLMGLEGFKRFWRQAGQQTELAYEVRQYTAAHVPTYWGERVSYWNDGGGGVYMTPRVPQYLRSQWTPEIDRAAGIGLPEIWRELDLDNVARQLGYDPAKKPIEYMDDHLRPEVMKKIGAWLE